MKKVLIIFLLAVMLFSLAACINDSAAQDNSAQEPSVSNWLDRLDIIFPEPA